MQGGRSSVSDKLLVQWCEVPCNFEGEVGGQWSHIIKGNTVHKIIIDCHIQSGIRESSSEDPTPRTMELLIKNLVSNIYS